MKRILLLIALLCAWSAQAQGTFTYRFDWHGYSNFFHVSFVVTEQDLATSFTSPLFLSSISLTNPPGDVFGASSVILAGGTYSRGWYLSINFVTSSAAPRYSSLAGRCQMFPTIPLGLSTRYLCPPAPIGLRKGSGP